MPRGALRAAWCFPNRLSAATPSAQASCPRRPSTRPIGGYLLSGATLVYVARRAISMCATCHFQCIGEGPHRSVRLMHHRLPHRPPRRRPALPVRVPRARIAPGLRQARTARRATVAPLCEADLPDKGAVGRPTRRGRGGAALLSGRRRNARHCSGRRCLASRAAARTERALPRARQSGRGRGSQTTACSVRRRGCAATPPRRDAHAADTRRASTACVAQSAASRRGTPGCSRRGSGSRRAPPSRA